MAARSDTAKLVPLSTTAVVFPLPVESGPILAEPMSLSDIDSKFEGIWRRALNEPSLGALTPELIAKWASDKGLADPIAIARDVGRFHPTPSIVLEVGGRKACFPKSAHAGDQLWNIRRKAKDNEALPWGKMEWFMPLWLPMDKIRQMLSAVKHCTKERASSFSRREAFRRGSVIQLRDRRQFLLDACRKMRRGSLSGRTVPAGIIRLRHSCACRPRLGMAASASTTMSKSRQVEMYFCNVRRLCLWGRKGRSPGRL
jgi:hypothetical protein